MNEFSRLFRDARAGEPRSLDVLVRRFEGGVHHRIHQRLPYHLRRRYDTADVAQSVFAQAVRDLPGLVDKGEQAFRHWLYVIAERKVWTKARRELGRQRRLREAEHLSEAGVDLETGSPSHDAMRGEESARLWRHVDDLEGEARLVLVMRFREGLSFAEIAERMGLPSADAARKRHARAIFALKRRAKE